MAQDAAAGELLIFIHGTASNCRGRFGQRIYCFEHYTFSLSPIENALALVRNLASSNLDLFLSGLLNLIGFVSALNGNPI